VCEEVARFSPNVRTSGPNTADRPGLGSLVPSASTSRSTPVSWSAMSSAESKRRSGSRCVALANNRWYEPNSENSGTCRMGGSECM
jgi:hypothetical protein